MPNYSGIKQKAVLKTATNCLTMTIETNEGMKNLTWRAVKSGKENGRVEHFSMVAKLQ